MTELKQEYESRLEKHKKGRIFSGMSIEVIQEEYFLRGMKHVIDRIESGHKTKETQPEKPE